MRGLGFAALVCIGCEESVVVADPPEQPVPLPVFSPFVPPPSPATPPVVFEPTPDAFSGHLPVPIPISDESSVCWTLAPHGGQLQLIAVGMDSGSVHVVQSFGAVGGSWYTGGIAFDGDHTLAMSAYGGNASAWTVLDLLTSQRTVGEWAGGVSLTFHDGHWLARGTFNGLVFEDSTSLLARQADPIPWDAHGTRFQAYDDVLYHAWHSTNQVGRLDLNSGLELGPVTLESYDTWVWGIGVNETYLHLIDDGRGVGNPVWDSRIARFLHDGTFVDDVFIDQQLYGRASGLWCR